MEFREYLRVLRRRRMLVLGNVLLALAISAVLSYATTPQYASSARLFVSTTQSSSGEAYAGSLFSAQRVTSYAELVTGRELSLRVSEELEPKWRDLRYDVDAEVVPQTVILQITVQSSSPEGAQRVAQTTAEELTVLVDELETPPGRTRAPIKATVIDAASLPQTPVSPRSVRNLGLAGLVGLLLGLGLALLRELLDTSVKSADDVAAVTDTVVMGEINYDSSTNSDPLITDLGSHSPRLEAFRTLRTNLQFVEVDRDSKVFVVTSSVPEEGKSTTAVNLALVLGQAGRRVLLLEADLRRPRIQDLLGMEPTVGLTTVLVGCAALSHAIQEYDPVPNLAVVTSGAIPPNPAELLQSQAMSDLLDQFRADYDVVLVDAPPLLPVTDAAILAAVSDGALIVARHGKTSREQLRQSMQRLEAVGGRALGVVLNMVPDRGESGAYGHGYRRGYAAPAGDHSKKAPVHRQPRSNFYPAPVGEVTPKRR